MAVPTVATWSVDALEAAHESFRVLIDAGTGAGKIRIRDASDVLLSEVALSDPCGTVSAVTGQLTFSIAGPDASADATGVAAYGEFADSDNNVQLSLPAAEGAVAVSGKIVLNSLSIIELGAVTVVSATVG